MAFNDLVAVKGSDVVYHKSAELQPCPCLTREGFRDPEWHILNPGAPICNERGYLDTSVEVSFKGFVQPMQSARAMRIPTDLIEQLFGEIKIDDHVGIFPVTWNGFEFDFQNWGRAGEDYIVYNNQKFIVVGANLIPDPADGNPKHHWELGLRKIENNSVTQIQAAFGEARRPSRSQVINN